MSALMISTITVKDAAKFQEYLAKTQEVAQTFGAELVFRGKLDRVLNGNGGHQIVVVAKFPSAEKLNAWFDSPEYQLLIPLREEGAHMNMTAYDAIG